MASPLRLTVSITDDSAAAGQVRTAWAVIRAEFEASEQAMSRFRETSEVTFLNRRAGRDEATAVSRRLSRALVASDRAHRLTNGRFDPRVLVDLQRLGDGGADIGEVGRTRVKRGQSAGRLVVRQPDGRFRLPSPVDLGGIGKGLALRWAAAAAARCGLDSFLLEAGGDLVANGEPPDGGPWRVGLEAPDGGSLPLAVICATNDAVATSSVRRRHWIVADRAVHHLIDPRTGEPGGAGLRSVTVAGADPAWAEVWSKTLFLEGRAAIAAVARRRGLAAWWVDDNGALEMTAGARMRTLWTAVEGERSRTR